MEELQIGKIPTSGNLHRVRETSKWNGKTQIGIPMLLSPMNIGMTLETSKLLAKLVNTSSQAIAIGVPPVISLMTGLGPMRTVQKTSSGTWLPVSFFS